MPQTPQMPPDSLDTACCQEPQRFVTKSLNDILRQHAGTSLFVRPMYWRDIHSELLGVRFVELPPCSTPSPESIPGSAPSQGHLRPSKTVKLLSLALTRLQTPVQWNTFLADAHYTASYASRVNTVLMELWPSAFRLNCPTNQHIFYGDRVYRDIISPQVMWNYSKDSARSTTQSSLRSTSARAEADSNNSVLPSTSSPHDRTGLPMMCYISKRELELRRYNLFRWPHGNSNSPVRRLLQHRFKALKPANPNHDPVFVAIFLAMAQHHFYGDPYPSKTEWCPSRAPSQRPPFEDLCLRILSHDVDAAEFIVYTGYITATFLDSFWSPSKAPPEEEQGSSGMKIEYTRVPMWPILGLRERLGKALGQDIVGAFDATKMETWQTDEVVDEVQSRKRKADGVVPCAVTKGSKQETDRVVDEIRSTKRKADDAVSRARTKGSKQETDRVVDEIRSTKRKADGVVPCAVTKSSKQETDDDEETPLTSVSEKRRRLPDGSPVKVAV